MKIMLIILIFASFAFGDDYAASTLTKTGQKAPLFSVTTLDGIDFSSKSLKGKVVLLNFFATWCGPCMAELPEVEKEIWSKFQLDDLIVLAIGREHNEKELKEWNNKKKFTFYIAPDPDRNIYSKFATKYIPRTYLIDKRGKIVFQSIGFNKEEFDELKRKIDELL